MKSKCFLKLILLILLCSLLASCHSANTQPAPLQLTPTSLPSTLPPSASVTPEPTATPVPTETPLLPTATITASPEQPVTSLEEITGIWKGYWSDQNMLLFKIGVTGLTNLEWEKGGLLVSEWVTVENGIMTWGKIVKGDAIPTKCLENPTTTYEVYLTKRGDQPESLRFALVGSDNCYDRQTFYDGQVLTWQGTE